MMTASPASAEVGTNSNGNALASREYGKSEIKKKNWQVFPGRNEFYCDGRIITARQSGVLYFTLSLIIVTVALFFAFDCRLTLVTDIEYGFFIPVFGGLLFFFSLFCLLRTAWSDPGIIPRASAEEAAYIEKCIQAEEAQEENSQNFRSLPRTLDVIINGAPLKLKFCYSCKIFRPPRASHCSLCDNCVENFDHHCPWVGNCVGRRNYRYFYLFVISLCILCLFIFSFAIVNIVLLSQKDGNILEAIKQSPGSILEIIVCFLSVWSILGLGGFHSYLISKSLTTNEDIKRSWAKKRDESSVKNPFDQGGCFRNFFYTLCSPVPPSLIDRRGYASEQRINEYETRRRQNGVLYGSSNTVQNNQSLQPYPTMENLPSYPRQQTNYTVQTEQGNTATHHDNEPAVTISHHALTPDDIFPSDPTTRFSYNANNSTTHDQYGCYNNDIAVHDDLSSQPGIIIEHLGPGSALSGVTSNSISSVNSQTILVESKPKKNGSIATNKKSNSFYSAERDASPL